MTALHVDRLLDHGDRITAADRQLRVVAVPGHTPGSLLLHDDGGALFTGDHVLPRMAPSSGIQFQDGRRIPSLPAYLAALQETRCLAGQTRTFYPGHGTPSTDLAAAVAWSIRLLEQRARRTLAALRRGPGSAYALALRMFPHLTPHHRRAALAECIGLLDLLATRGLAFARETSDAVIWQASPFTDAGAPGRQQSGSRSST